MVLLPHKYWWGKFARGHPETPLVDADCTWNGLVYGTLYHLSQDTSIKNAANHSETAKLDIYSQWTLNTFFGVKVALVFFGQEIDSMTWDLEAFHKPRAAIGILRPGVAGGLHRSGWSLFHVFFMGKYGKLIYICYI